MEEQDDGYWALVEPIWYAISIYDGPEVFLSQFAAAPEAPRVLFAAHWCQSEVRNGGLSQFFANPTGVLAPEAVEAYRTLGLPELAALVERAMTWFGARYPRAREAREEKLDAYEADHPDHESPFEDLDNRFFDLIHSESGGFVAAADAYAKLHGG